MSGRGDDMKALVFGDIHGDTFMLELLKKKAEQADVVFCLGDLTIFGEGLELMLQMVDEFPTPVYLIHGNHETEEEMQQTIQTYPNISYIHKKALNHDEYTIIGYGGDGFSRYDEEFEKMGRDMKEWLQTPHKTIMLLHGPPSDTKLDMPFEGHHGGNESYRAFIEENEPLIVFSGHIHECEGEHDTIGKTILHNPGPEGIIVDINELVEKRTG